jgi:small subunit ribosomal protein S16
MVLAAKIKLKRMGAKKKPFYRIVVMDESAATKAVAADIIGRYDPRRNPGQIEFDKVKTEKWLKCGATPTERVRILLGKAGILPPVNFEGKTKKKPKGEAAKAVKEAAAPAAAEATA